MDVNLFRPASADARPSFNSFSSSAPCTEGAKELMFGACLVNVRRIFNIISEYATYMDTRYHSIHTGYSYRVCCRTILCINVSLFFLQHESTRLLPCKRIPAKRKSRSELGRLSRQCPHVVASLQILHAEGV